jgi:23S rRNA (guanosine2251-2'-O)-methyltransferase
MPRDRGRRGVAARQRGGDVDVVVAGRRAVLEAVRAGVATQVLVAREARSTPALRDIIEAAATAGILVEDPSRDELDGLANDHRGVVARIRPPRSLDERKLAEWPFADGAVVVVLDGIEDPQNLGAAARSAEAAGAAMLVTRTRRSADVTSAAIRASAGALLHLPHARVANIARALERLKDVGFTAVGLDERSSTSILDTPAPRGRLAVVLGSEGSGLARLTREACDTLVSLPMLGRVGSLNASASLAAVLYGWVLPSRHAAEP